MKKLSLLLVFALCAYVTVSAQSDERSQGVTTKSGAQILPAAGDYAIGVSVNPFLNYIGGIFSDTDATAPFFGNDEINGVKDLTIYGKYFLAPDRALRVALELDLSKKTSKDLVDKIGGNAGEKVDDVTKDGTTKIDLSVGYELRRGYGRLQGFYGAGVGLNYASTTWSKEYGNAISATNPVTNTTKRAGGGTFGFEVGGFAGVEYFVAPKISIGAEVNLGLIFSNVPKGKRTTESWDGSKVKEDSVEAYNADGNTKFGTLTGGNIFLLFHF
ncbi:MAG: hypothetical protein LBM08_04890 [Dysgonamonadaceae bacterium]|jgi:hypothetical protein|nr:hypothetical protein [Dysgonamonadaceae bacterium]